MIGGIPPSMDRSNGISTPLYYLLKQTHEPLFRCDDLENYTSRVLKKWNRSLDYKEFIFYPDTSLKFNKKVFFTKEFFNKYINSITTQYNSKFQITYTAESVRIRFDKSQKRYLYFLTWHENAPAIKETNIEYGLGAFEIDVYSKEKIVMSRKEYVRNGFNKIVYYKYKGESDSNLENQKIQDFNLLSSFQQPEWIKKKYIGVQIPEPRTIVLLINHPDKRVRENLYNCIDVQKFRRAFVPQRKEFYDVKTVLPMGIPGAKAGLPRQICSKGKIKKHKEIIFLNQRKDNKESLKEYFDELGEEKSLKINIKNISMNALSKLLKNHKKNPFSYNLLEIF